MAAKGLAHSSYFEQAAVKEFLLKTEEEKKELVSQNTLLTAAVQLRRKVRREQRNAVLR